MKVEMKIMKVIIINGCLILKWHIVPGVIDKWTSLGIFC